MGAKRERKKQCTEAFTRSDSVRHVSILSFGYALRELRQKHAALSKLGFKMQSYSNFQTVRGVVRSAGRKFGFLLIGPTVPDDERRTISDLYRAHNGRGNVIVFYRSSIRNGERATALLNERGSPDNLLDAIRALSGEANVDEVGELGI